MDWGEDVGRGDGESRTDTQLGDEVGSTSDMGDRQGAVPDHHGATFGSGVSHLMHILGV